MAKVTGATPPSPARPAKPKRAFGRSLSDFPNLSAAEKELVECCAKGKFCVLGDGTRPGVSTNANTIRAELIRFLALGGDDAHAVHEKGVMLRGSWIKGELSLRNATALVGLRIHHCHFDSTLDFMTATLPELILIGSEIPRLDADGVTVKGDVFLRDGFAANGEVRLVGGQVGGDLDCGKGSFCNSEGSALIADRLEVKGGVFLNDGFMAKGQVRLLGVRIGGNLTCKKGSFSNPKGNALITDRITVEGSVFLCDGFAVTGNVSLNGAQIWGNLYCENGSFSNPQGVALTADGILVKGVAFLRNAKIDGALNLATASLGTLADDVACWNKGAHVFDGLQYDRIIGPIDAETRIQWLNRQRADHLDNEFKPQPWEQLINVLRQMGHPEDAAKVAIAKQDQWRVATAATAERPIGEKVRRCMHWVYGWFAGYGHRPIWTVYWMSGIWFIWSLLFMAGAYFNYIGPSTPLLNSPTLAPAIDEVCGHRGQPGKQKWTECSEVPAEYSTFQPFVYSLDLILPLVDLQQDSDWAPIVEDPPGTDLLFGVILRWAMWIEILFGWIASLTLVAVLGRLVDKD